MEATASHSRHASLSLSVLLMRYFYLRAIGDALPLAAHLAEVIAAAAAPLVEGLIVAVSVVACMMLGICGSRALPPNRCSDGLRQPQFGSATES